MTENEIELEHENKYTDFIPIFMAFLLGILRIVFIPRKIKYMIVAQLGFEYLIYLMISAIIWHSIEVLFERRKNKEYSNSQVKAF